MPNQKLAPAEFVRQFAPFAKATETKTGISAVAILAQAALESGWAERAVGNMFFGVKDSDGINGNEQLLTTTEFLKSPNLGHLFPEVISIKPAKNGRWKYTVKDWFRKFDTPEESFSHHAQFFLTNKRYAAALKVGHDPIAFFREIAKAGYATGPKYFEVLTAVARMIIRHLPPAAPAPRTPAAPPTELESVNEAAEEELSLDVETLRALLPLRMTVELLE
jgi:flagellum-specific peptidoglycan hydrolase FlgJ